MTDKEALKLMLDALLDIQIERRNPMQKEAIAAAREALAQPDAFEQGRQEGMKQERALWELSRIGQEIEAQEPVGVVKDLFSVAAWERLDVRGSTKVYLETPTQRPWVGLTDEEINECVEMSIQKTCRAIEAKLKEKNT